MEQMFSQVEGFVPLVWSGDDHDESSRIALHTASLQDRNPSWGGDCCDDGCESS